MRARRSSSRSRNKVHREDTSRRGRGTCRGQSSSGRERRPKVTSTSCPSSQRLEGQNGRACDSEHLFLPVVRVFATQRVELRCSSLPHFLVFRRITLTSC